MLYYRTAYYVDYVRLAFFRLRPNVYLIRQEPSAIRPRFSSCSFSRTGNKSRTDGNSRRCTHRICPVYPDTAVGTTLLNLVQEYGCLSGNATTVHISVCGSMCGCLHKQVIKSRRRSCVFGILFLCKHLLASNTGQKLLFESSDAVIYNNLNLFYPN